MAKMLTPEQWATIKLQKAARATWERLGTEYEVAHQGLSARFRREQRKQAASERNTVAKVERDVATVS
jgi:hypothetical protein